MLLSHSPQHMGVIPARQEAAHKKELLSSLGFDVEGCHLGRLLLSVGWQRIVWQDQKQCVSADTLGEAEWHNRTSSHIYSGKQNHVDCLSTLSFAVHAQLFLYTLLCWLILSVLIYVNTLISENILHWKGVCSCQTKPLIDDMLSLLIFSFSQYCCITNVTIGVWWQVCVLQLIYYTSTCKMQPRLVTQISGLQMMCTCHISSYDSSVYDCFTYLLWSSAWTLRSWNRMAFRWHPAFGCWLMHFQFSPFR